MIFSGEWHVFSGNELGALLGWWMIHTYQVVHPDVDMSETYMLASTVSSKILASMGKKEGFNFEVCIYVCTFNMYVHNKNKIQYILNKNKTFFIGNFNRF